MATFLSFSLVTIAFLFQSTIVVDLFLLRGTSDIVLIILLSCLFNYKDQYNWYLVLYSGILVGVASELPYWIPILEYVLVVWGVKYIEIYIWQSPLLVLFVSIILGSLIIYLIDYIYIALFAVPLEVTISFSEAFDLVILPGLILNFLLCLPIYGLVGELFKFTEGNRVNL